MRGNSRPTSAIGPSAGIGASSDVPLSPPRSNSQTPAHSPPKDSDHHSATRDGSRATSSSGMTSPLSPISPARPGAGSAGVNPPDVWNAVEPASRRDDALSPPPTWPRMDGQSPTSSNGASLPPEILLNADDVSYTETPGNAEQQQQHKLGKAKGSTMGGMHCRPQLEFMGSQGASGDVGRGTTQVGSWGVRWGRHSPSIWNGPPTASGASQTISADSGPLRSVTFATDSQALYSNSFSASAQSQLAATSPTIAVPSSDLEIPQNRQARSFSFSLGQRDSDFFGRAPPAASFSSLCVQAGSASAIGQGHTDAPRGDTGGYRQRLASMPEDVDFEQSVLMAGVLQDPSAFTLPKLRSRSKSSAAAYGPPLRDSIVSVAPSDESLIPSGYGTSNSPAYHPHRASVGAIMGNSQAFSSIWRADPPAADAHEGRGDGDYWTTSAAGASCATAVDMSGTSSAPDAQRHYLLSQALSGLGSADPSRRYPEGVRGLSRSAETEHLNHRRHSVAGPTLSFINAGPDSRHLADALGFLRLDDMACLDAGVYKPGMVESSLDDYFDNRETRAARVAAAAASATFNNSSSSATSGTVRGSVSSMDAHLQSVRDADLHLGKGVPLHAVPHQGPLYIVEFKAGRSDLFYVVPESPNQQIKKGDLVIVEADRGKDLGKVVNDDITPVQVQMLQQRQAEAAAVAEMGMSIPGMSAPTPSPVKELHPKRIYRLAQPAEVTMLVNKSQDESKAMLLCQTKVRHKNLPMEVVDAEYQWDRRKLTFYFIAERRIDFRELVRDLFKIYKTRIWMCAVNPNANSAVPGLNSLKH